MHLQYRNKRSVKIGLLLIAAILHFTNAEPKRGSIETCYYGDSLDFSAINDTCQKRSLLVSSCAFNTCAKIDFDVRFTNKFAIAPHGIQELDCCSDTNGIDTLQKVPLTGYQDSVSFVPTDFKQTFAIKTSENTYAILQCIGHGSGLPFIRFKWAYQPDGSNVFRIDSTPPVHPVVQSGFWTFMHPIMDTNNAIIDFSQLNRICATTKDHYTCSIQATDCYFTNDSIIGTNGVYYDSAMSEEIQKKYMLGKHIESDHEGYFYLDSIMKAFRLVAPKNNYKKSYKANLGMYFVKTTENHFAALVKTGEYIGGIVRTYYYWVYQPDSTNILYKDEIVEYGKTLAIVPSVFSGRPDPVFKITDSLAIRKIVHQILVSINPLFDSTIHRADSLQCKNILGYNKIRIANMFGPDNPISSLSPSLDVCHGLIKYNKISFSSVLPQPVYLYDKDSRLEKLIVKVCCDLNLTVTDSYGTVKFCDCIPDSLKEGNFAIRNKVMQKENNPIGISFVTQKKIGYRVHEPGVVSIDLYDLRGRRIYENVLQMHQRGSYCVDLKENKIRCGAYILSYAWNGLHRTNFRFAVVNGVSRAF